MNTCTNTHRDIHTHAYKHTFTYTYVHVYVHVNVYAHRYIATHTHVYTHLTHVYTHTCMQTHMHTYMHVCRGAHTHIHRHTDTRAGWGENSSPGLPFLFTLPQDPTLGPRLPQEGAADRCQTCHRGPPPGLRRVPEVSSSIPLGASTPLLFRRFADHPLLAEGLRVHLSKRAEEPRGGPVISITAGPGGSHCLLHVRGFSPGKVASVLCSCLSWRSSVLTPSLFSCG